MDVVIFDERWRPFALYVIIAHCTVLVNRIHIMKHETGKSRTMWLRNATQTLPDNSSNHPFRKATPNTRTRHAKNNDIVDCKGSGDNAESNNNTTDTVVDSGNIVTSTSSENQESDVVTDNKNSMKNANNADDEEGEDKDEDDEMSEEMDLRHTVTVDSIGKTFPAPDENDYADIAADPNFYGRAGWFAFNAALIEALLEEFVQDKGWLPCSIPVGATCNRCWEKQFCCLDSDLTIGHSSTLRSARDAFAKKFVGGFNRINTCI